MITAPIELELRKLGLTEKEVRVYLAGLELGPSSVQNIAQKAGLTRPTTYEIIEKLKEKRLFSETAKEKKKKFFVAQSPESILGLLRIQKREIQEKERELIRIIATMEDKYSKAREGIKTFKGREGLKSLEEIISFSSTPDIIIVNPGRLPIGIRRRKIVYQEIKKRLGKLEIKEINSEIAGSLIIFDKVAFFSPNKKEAFLFY